MQKPWPIGAFGAESGRLAADGSHAAVGAQGEVGVVVKCKDCRFWGKVLYEWDGARPCMNEDEAEDGPAYFFVGGGDNNDGLYTSAEFGCVCGKARTDEE